MAVMAVGGNAVFDMVAGNKILIPEGVSVATSVNRNKFPNTPKVVRVYKHVTEGTYNFGISEDLTCNSYWKKCALFVPGNVVPGETSLVVKWVEGNCACAEHAL